MARESHTGPNAVSSTGTRPLGECSAMRCRLSGRSKAMRRSSYVSPVSSRARAARSDQEEWFLLPITRVRDMQASTEGAPRGAGPEQTGPSRANAPGSGAVFGVDPHVFVGQVGGPDGLAAVATAQLDADGDLLAGHHRRALFLGVAGGARAATGDADIAEEHVDQADIQVRHAGVADRGQD